MSAYSYTHAVAINKKDREFEDEQEVAYEWVWREKREGRNIVIISKTFSNLLKS